MNSNDPNEYDGLLYPSREGNLNLRLITNNPITMPGSAAILGAGTAATVVSGPLALVVAGALAGSALHAFIEKKLVKSIFGKAIRYLKRQFVILLQFLVQMLKR